MRSILAAAILLLAACGGPLPPAAQGDHAIREASADEVQAARACADITGHTLDAPDAAPGSDEARREDEFSRCLKSVTDGAAPPPLRGRTEAPS